MEIATPGMPTISFEPIQNEKYKVIFIHPESRAVLDSVIIGTHDKAATLRVGLTQLQLAEKLLPRKGEAKKILMDDIEAYQWLINDRPDLIDSYLEMKKQLMIQPRIFKKTMEGKH